MVSESTSVVVVTGASAGIGSGVCSWLANEGHLVVGISRSSKPLSSDCQHWYAADVSDEIQIRAAALSIQERFGTINALINCAGNYSGGALVDIEVQDLTKAFSVNTFGTILACKEFSKIFPQEGGTIVNVGSLLTRRTLPQTSLYTASKGAVVAFTKALAHELAPAGIRVNCVSPSLVDSEIYVRAGMSRTDYLDMLTTWSDMFPLGRLGTPMDVAAAISFLISPGASWITGLEMIVDGGRGVA